MKGDKSTYHTKIFFKSETEKLKWISLVKSIGHTIPSIFKIGLKEALKRHKDLKDIEEMGGCLRAVIQLKKLGPRMIDFIVDTKIGNKKKYKEIDIFEISVDISGKYIILYKDIKTKKMKMTYKGRKYIKTAVLDEWFGKGNY